MSPGAFAASEARDGVSLTTDGALATISLRRAASRNAMRLCDWRDLQRLVAEAERDDTVAVILLRGAGGCFGSGNDIGEFGALRRDPIQALAFGRAMADAMAAVESASKPVVAAIEGACYGASVALALASDLRVASGTAVFAITPAKLGALYLRSDLHRLTAAIGASQARRLIFTSQAIDAAGALRMGLVDDVHPATTFEAQVETLVSAIARGSSFTLRRTKAMLLALDAVRAPPETPESLAAFVEATQGADFTEGVDAFLAKRPPRFGQPLSA